MDKQNSSRPVAGRSTLRIRRESWEAAVRQLQTTSSKYAVGPLRRHGDRTDLLLLADHLNTTEHLPTVPPEGPNSDVVIVVMHDDHQHSTDHILKAIKSVPHRLLVVVELFRDQPQQCRFWQVDRSEVRSVESVEIIGKGMLRLSDDAVPIDFDRHRASRTEGALGTTLYERLRRSTVTVVGLGRNGSQLCFMLAGLGVGRLRLLDSDILEPENLDGMPGLTADDIGLTKAEALADRLMEFNPDLSLTYLESSMTTQEAAMLLHRSCDLFVTTVDDDAPRLGVSLLANQTLTPHLDIGTAIQAASDGGRTMTADIRMLLPGMCVSCIGGLANAEASLYTLAAPDGALQRGQRREWSDQRAGSLVHWNAIACGVGVEAWLSLLRGDAGAMWHRLTTNPGGELGVSAAAIAATGKCRFCEST